jgi:hypothetical protein
MQLNQISYQNYSQNLAKHVKVLVTLKYVMYNLSVHQSKFENSV